MRTLMFSGHCMNPYALEVRTLAEIIYCRKSKSQKLSIGEQTYLMHFNAQSDADINVIGWCIKDFQTIKDSYPRNPIRGNIAFTHANGHSLSDEDINKICSFIENHKDTWAEGIALTYTRLTKEYVESQKSQSTMMHMFYEDVKAILNLYKIMMHAVSGRGSIDIEKDDKTYYLELKTTGLSFVHDEILSITILDDDGIVVLDQLIKPKRKTSWVEAEEIHHITPAMVEQMPGIEKIMPNVIELFDKASYIGMYNAKFAMEFLIRRAKKYRELIWKKSYCVMLDFADCYREYDAKHHFKKSFHLEDAMRIMSISWIGEQHSSIARVMSCRKIAVELVHWMNLLYEDYSDAPVLQIALKMYEADNHETAEEYLKQRFNSLLHHYQTYLIKGQDTYEQLLDLVKVAAIAVDKYRNRYG